MEIPLSLRTRTTRVGFYERIWSTSYVETPPFNRHHDPPLHIIPLVQKMFSQSSSHLFFRFLSPPQPIPTIRWTRFYVSYVQLRHQALRPVLLRVSTQSDSCPMVDTSSKDYLPEETRARHDHDLRGILKKSKDGERIPNGLLHLSSC